MVQVEGCEYENGQLPVGLAHVFFVVQTVSYTFLLFDLAYHVCDVDLVFFVERFQILEHRKLQVCGLMLECCCSV